MCSCEAHQGYTLACTHSFCLECLGQYLINKIKEGAVYNVFLYHYIMFVYSAFLLIMFSCIGAVSKSKLWCPVDSCKRPIVLLDVRQFDYTLFLCPAPVRLYWFPVSNAGHRKTV
eukprot:SAG31_NODE_30_length_32545_cov_9.378999_32_plen_115_part_00